MDPFQNFPHISNDTNKPWFHLQMKVADLKRELKLRGLTVTGKKEELVERLQVKFSHSAEKGKYCVIRWVLFGVNPITSVNRYLGSYPEGLNLIGFP